VIIDYTAVIVGLLGAMIAFTAAGYIRASLAEIDPNYQAPPSSLEGPLLGDIMPALHYWNLRHAAASVIFFTGAALLGLALLMQVLTSWG
jgi:hypothetical protein